MTRLGKVSCGFVAFELKGRERERTKRTEKATTQQEMGIFLQNEESSFQQAEIVGAGWRARIAVWPSETFSCLPHSSFHSILGFVFKGGRW